MSEKADRPRGYPNKSINIFGIRLFMPLAFGIVALIAAALSIVAVSYGVPLTSFHGTSAIERETMLNDLGIAADYNKNNILKEFQAIRVHVFDLSRSDSLKELAGLNCELLEYGENSGVKTDHEPKNIDARAPMEMQWRSLTDLASGHRGFQKIQLVDVNTGKILQSSAPVEVGAKISDSTVIKRALEFPHKVSMVLEEAGLSAKDFSLVFSTIVSRTGSDSSRDCHFAFLVYYHLDTCLRESLFVPGILGETTEILLAGNGSHWLTIQSPSKKRTDQASSSEETYKALFLNLRNVQGKEDDGQVVPVGAQRYLVAVRHIPLTADLNLQLIVKQDEEEALAGVHEKMRQAILVASVGLMFGGLLALGVAGFISRPINDLTKAVMAIQAGDPTVRVPGSALPDLNFLAESFNSMVDEIQESKRQLESRVQKRTELLQKLNLELEEEIVRRKQTEEELRERESFLLQAQNIAHFGTWVLDPKSGDASWSSEVYRIFGFSEVDFPVNLEFFKQLVYPDDLDYVDRSVAESLENKTTLNLDYRIVTPNGEIRHIYARGATYVDATGVVTRMLGTCYDVTDIKHREIELQAYIEEIEDLYNSAPCGYHSVDGDGIFVRMNDTELNWLGYSRDEVINKMGLSDLISKSFIEEYGELFAEFKQRGFFNDFECELRRKDGTVLPVTISATAVRDSAGNFVMSRSTVFDITERKLAENILRESEQRFKRLSEASFEGILISRQGTIVDANENIAEMLKCDVSELIGKPQLSFVHEDFKDLVMYQIYLDKEEPYEAQLVAKDGSVITVTVRGRTTFLDGAPVRLTSIRDITLQKNAEKENEELRSQLFESQKMEAIGTLAGGIAHDFNNILTAIMGYTELALHSTLSQEKQQSYLEKVYQAGNRARDLVQQILTFSRHSEQTLVDLQVGPIIKETVKFLRASIPATIEIRSKIQGELGLVKADPTQLHQVLMNLCTNASHAMRKGGGVLGIEVTEEQIDQAFPGLGHEMPPGKYIRLVVSDTGVGIPPDVLERIFEPYFTTKPAGEGTGLGLAVVHGIVKKMGGSLRVSSKVGVGATFEVYFPIVEGLKKPEQVAEETALPIGNERILFVDDEPMVVEVIKGLLEPLGYRLEMKTSSLEAWELFESKPHDFDLVITDMTMPQLTGPELASRIREIRPETPIILCTGYGTDITEERLQELGLSALIMKPVNSRDMAIKVRMVLDQSAHLDA